MGNESTKQPTEREQEYARQTRILQNELQAQKIALEKFRAEQQQKRDEEVREQQKIKEELRVLKEKSSNAAASQSLYPNLNNEHETNSAEPCTSSKLNNFHAPISKIMPASAPILRAIKPHKDSKLNCLTCGSGFVDDVFRCAGGHSSCGNCQRAGHLCGLCAKPLTTIRDYELQNHLLDMEITCSNADDGCLHTMPRYKLQSHLVQYRFNDLNCPISLFGNCTWKGKMLQLASHFDECHEKHKSCSVGTELVLPDIIHNQLYIIFVTLEKYKFFVNIRVCNVVKRLFMTVQILGTPSDAEEWLYELHIYNKSAPIRKFFYSDKCLSINDNVMDVFLNNDCAVMPLAYAFTMVNKGGLACKFYIKRANFEDNDNSQNRRNRRYGRGKNYYNSRLRSNSRSLHDQS